MTGRILFLCDGPAALTHSIPLLNLLKQKGFSVKTAPTPMTLNLLTSLAWSLASGHPCLDYNGLSSQNLQDAELILACPASLQLLDQLKQGRFAEAGRRIIAAPVLLAHENTPAFLSRLRTELPEYITLIEPENNRENSGKGSPLALPDLNQCLEQVIQFFTPQDFAGRHVLLTAGPTVEDIDPVRFLSNRSTGRMGTALATEALRRGAQVTLIHGPMQCSMTAHPALTCVPVRSAEEMYHETNARINGTDIAVLCAAVADFTPNTYVPQKIKKSRELGLTLLLHSTPDILQALGQLKNPPFLVGFAAESDNVEENARIKLQAKNCDLLCANDVMNPQCGFAVSTNQVTIYDRKGEQQILPLVSKEETARRIFDRILKEMRPAARS